MKKVLFVLAVLAIGLFYPGTAFAGASVDQQYSNAGDGSLAVNPQAIARQSFRPSMSTLTKVSLNLTNTSGTVGCGVDKYNGNDWDPIVYINDQPAIDGWNDFDFTDTTVVVSARYRIWLQASTDDTQWYYGTSLPYGPYPNGIASWGQANTTYADTDFHFKTWGTNPVEIVEEQTNPGSDQDPEQTGVTESTTTNATTGSAPATQTTTSIKPPTKLTASFDSSVQLAWNASTTTDIDGYIIFRSETIGKNYTQVGKTIKSVIDYSDKTVTAGKTYYYIVRAYKGTGQSANSNEATVTVPENAVIAADTETAVSTSDIQTTANRFGTTFWILVGIDFALILVLLFLMIRRHYKQKKN